MLDSLIAALLPPGIPHVPHPLSALVLGGFTPRTPTLDMAAVAELIGFASRDKANAILASAYLLVAYDTLQSLVQQGQCVVDAEGWYRLSPSQTGHTALVGWMMKADEQQARQEKKMARRKKGR